MGPYCRAKGVGIWIPGMGLEVDSSGSKNAARVEGVDAEPGAVLHSGEENKG